jgi:protein O-mannosyl-transferase
MSGRARAATLALLVAAVWAPSLRNGFVWDDQYDILRSDRLHHARAVVDVFRHHAMWSADQPETEISTYRPLALATLAVDWQLWHTHAAGYHATNVLLHVLATLALFLALMVIVGDEKSAAVLALLFALHPANAEAVAWINGRSEMLALGFGALALWAARTRRWPALAAALLLAMLGKESGVVFVPVAVALATVGRGRALAAAAVAVVAYASLRAIALGHTALPSHAAAALGTLGPVWSRSTVAALLPWRRAPIELSTWIAVLTPHARVAWALAGASLAGIALALAVRRRWLAALGLGWWLLALAPTATIAALDYPWPGLGRWLYVGLPGLGLVAWVAARPLPSRARVALATAVGALFAVAAQRSIATWHDDEALYSAMVAETPDDAWAWRALGTVRLGAARWADAADCFHRAVTFDRTAEVHAAYALEAYAWTYLGRCDEAEAQFRAHPLTPALKSDEFEAALTACRSGPAKPLTPTTRRVKSTHVNGEMGAGASTRR